MYFCLFSQSKSFQGYPSGDSDLVKAFTKDITSLKDEIAFRIRCILVFTAIFKAVHEELAKFKCNSPLDWYQWLASTARGKIYETVPKYVESLVSL